jgi:hypothetical protein
METPRIHQVCPQCSAALNITMLSCTACGLILAHTKASLRPAHRGQIALMWTLYLLIPVFALLHLVSPALLMPLTMLFSLTSFGLAIWLVFQRSLTDLMNGALRLLLDVIVMAALAGLLLRAGTFNLAVLFR